MTTNRITSLYFMGTGPSSGVPNLACLSSNPCQNCLNIQNYRTCVSLLIQTQSRNILIDCGKDFYHQYLKFLSKRKTRLSTTELPIVLLTHPHADAILGLDSFKQMVPSNATSDLYCDQNTLKYLKKCFAYLFEQSYPIESSPGFLNPHCLTLEQPRKIDGIKITPFHVEHGHDNCLAFLIEDNILYISDCSSVDIDFVEELSMLIIDCTTINKYAYGHLNFYDVLKVIEKTKPLVTYLVGMSHHVDYNELKALIEESGKNIIIACDGMEVTFE